MTSKISNLYKKILYTIGLLLIYRIGSFITIPGIDPNLISEFSNNAHTGIIGMLNVFSGGALTRVSVFALSIYPYITASIVVQLLSFVYPSIKELNKQGVVGKNKINQITKYIALGIGIVQGYGIASSVKMINVEGQSVLTMDNSILFIVSTIMILVSGTMILVWLSSRISSRGIGNGSSLIICTSIISSLPNNFFDIFDLSRKGDLSIFSVVSILLVVFICILLVLFVEQSYRKIPIQYPKQHSFASHMQDKTYLPFKINIAGVMPPIFTNTLLLVPIGIMNFINHDSKLTYFINQHLSQGKPLFFVLSGIMFIFFSFFYVANALNLTETSSNLQKHGAYILGKRPGEQTTQYLRKVVNKLTVLGCVYLCFICFVPEILLSLMNIKFALSSTSLLIVVNVLLDFIEKVQTYNIDSKYSNLVAKKIKIRVKNR